jgi:hypothetical protein
MKSFQLEVPQAADGCLTSRGRLRQRLLLRMGQFCLIHYSLIVFWLIIGSFRLLDRVCRINSLVNAQAAQREFRIVSIEQ